jgi:uncharacterized protein (DUF342 family)
MVVLKDMNGYITITTESDGIYVTIFPPVGKGKMVTLADLKQELEKSNVGSINNTILSQLVKQQNGRPQKISNITASRPEATQCFVELSDDAMVAKITIIPPQSDTEKFQTIGDVRNALTQHQVVFGIDETKMSELAARLEEMASSKNMIESVEMEVAFGMPVKDGVDASLEFLYKKETEAAASEATPEGLPEDDEGRIDYRAVHQIDNVTKGTVLARKIPAQPGIPGKTVRGETIEPKVGKDIEVIASKGVIVSPENPSEWIADSEGQVIVKDNKISVLALYEIPGDVDFSTGNIDFIGTVIIRGDVKDGFKVFAGEDLVINGVVEAAELKCGGRLTIAGGLSGGDRAQVTCERDATIKYVRNAVVKVGGNLTVNQAIMHSKVTVGNKVVVAGKKGVIVGGQVVAGIEIIAASMGSNFATPTEVIVGEMLGLREELQQAENELKLAVENLEKTKKGIVFLKDLQAKLGGTLPPDKKELFTKLTRAQFKLMADTKTLTEKKQKIEKQEADGAEDRRKRTRVACLGIIHTGVKITINRASRQISEEIKYCTLTEIDGEIKVGPYK